MNDKIRGIRNYIDKKIVESINKDKIDALEYQEVLEKIDNMLVELVCKEDIVESEEIECEHLEYVKYYHKGEKYARCYICGDIFKIK